MKQCTKCKIVKEDSEFSKKQYYCKECMRKYKKNYDIINKNKKEDII